MDLEYSLTFTMWEAHSNLHFNYQQWTDTWRSEFEQKTNCVLLVDPRNEDHKDPEYIDYSAPRLARYLQNAWKRHQDTVILGR